MTISCILAIVIGNLIMLFMLIQPERVYEISQFKDVSLGPALSKVYELWYDSFKRVFRILVPAAL